MKQELNFSRLVLHNKNETKVMMYMMFITALLILDYKKEYKIEGYKIAKLKFSDELQMEIIKEIVVVCAGDPNKMRKLHNLN